MPWLPQLTPWVGHGFGQEATLKRPTLDAGTTLSGARKKALVPGCGGGHDAAYLAKVYGYDVVGLDISETAVMLAEENLWCLNDMLQRGCMLSTVDKQRNSKYPDLSGPIEMDGGAIKWVVGDFFFDKWLQEAGADKFDLIYDYQVGCPLPLADDSDSNGMTYGPRKWTLLIALCLKVRHGR